MNQEVQKFIDILKTDESLQKKMKSASEKFMAEQELAAFQNVVLPIVLSGKLDGAVSGRLDGVVLASSIVSSAD